MTSTTSSQPPLMHGDDLTRDTASSSSKCNKKQRNPPTQSVFERLRRHHRQRSPLFQRCGGVMGEDDDGCAKANRLRCHVDSTATPDSQQQQVKRDLFGVHIELYNLLIETERRKLKTLHCEMQQLSSSFPSLHSSRKYQHISYAKQRLGRLQAQLDQLEDEYRRAAYGALKSNHVNIGGSSKSKQVATECGTHASSSNSSSSSSSATKASQLAPPPMVKQQTVRTRPSIFGSLAALSPRVSSRSRHNENNNNNADQQQQKLQPLKVVNGNVNNNILNPPPSPPSAADAVTSSSTFVPHSSLPRNLSCVSSSRSPSRSNSNKTDLNQQLHSTDVDRNNNDDDTRPALDQPQRIKNNKTPNRRFSCVASASITVDDNLSHRENENVVADVAAADEKQPQYYRCVIPVVHNSTDISDSNMDASRFRSPTAAKANPASNNPVKLRPTASHIAAARPAIVPPALPSSSSTHGLSQKPPVSRSSVSSAKPAPPKLPAQSSLAKYSPQHTRLPQTAAILKQHVRSTSAKRAAPTTTATPTVSKSPQDNSIIQVKKNGATVVAIGGAPPLPKKQLAQNRQSSICSDADTDTEEENEEDETDDDDDFGRGAYEHDDTLRNILSSTSSSAIDYELLTPTHTRESLFRCASGGGGGGPSSICSSSVDSAILRESCSSCVHDDLTADPEQAPCSISPVIIAIASMCTEAASSAQVPLHDDCVSASDSNYHSSSGSSLGGVTTGSGSSGAGSDCDAASIQSQKAAALLPDDDDGENSRPSSSLLSQPVAAAAVHELRYENGTLASGTLDSLIVYFMPTSKHVPERTYSFAFVLSCRLFLRPEELLERVELLCIEHTELCDDGNAKDFSSKCSSKTASQNSALRSPKPGRTKRSSAANPVVDLTAAAEIAGLRHARCANEQQTKAFCRHVNRLLSDWAETFPYDFRQDFLMLRFKSISAFCSRYEPLLSVELDHTLQSLLQKLAELDEYEQHLARISQSTLERMKSAVNLSTPTTDVVQICPNPMIFAQQLTHVELERMQFIGPEEFVEAISDILKKKSPGTATKSTKSTTNSRRRRQLHNLDAYVDWFNRLSYLVATEVCMQLRRKHRVRLIDFFIEVAKECFNLGNYNSLMAIVAGLNMSSVRRLKRTWRRVNSTVKLDVLENAMSPSQNFLHYRSTLKAAMWRSAGSTTVTEKIIVPFFSLLIKDVYFLKEGCSGTLSDGTVNFTKFWQLAKQVSEFLAWREVVCPFERRPNVIDYVLTTAVFSETGLALASFECEAPETATERDRCRQLKLALNQAPCPTFGTEVR